MLPIVLVLFVASSAFAAPSVSVNQASINDVAPARDSGALVSSYVTNRAFELVDGGDSNIYILTIQQILDDLANQPDARTRAIALGQTLAVLGELANGIPGDACEAASAIDNYVRTGNAKSYLNTLARNIDTIARLAVNPGPLRYASGVRGGCAGSGRTYQFEAAWDRILDSANPYTIGLINEEYCAAKRLYNAFNIRSNNIGAATTAAALPGVVNAVQNASAEVANFLRAAISGGNASAAAASAKAALLRA